MIKIRLISILFLVLNIGCKKEKMNNPQKMKEEVFESVNNYEFKPYYLAKIQVTACYYEILLNDIPLISYGASGGISNELPLNNYILKSGKQLLKFRISPMFNQVKLSNQVDFEINIGFNNIMGEKKLSEYTQCISFQLPDEAKKAELPFFEFELPFQANVPWDYYYMIENAQNIEKKSNNKELIDNSITKLYTILKNRDAVKYKSFIFNSFKKESDVLFRAKDEIDFINEDSELTNIKDVFPLPEYDIRFYCEGKIVAVYNKMKDEDGNRFVIKYSIKPLFENGMDGIATEDYLFYLPEGGKELEIF